MPPFKKMNVAVFGPAYYQLYQQEKKMEALFQPCRKSAARTKAVLQIYMRLPGQQTTVKVTLFLCSFSIGTSEEWLMPTVDSPFTATIMSPHLKKETKWKAADEQ